MGARARVPALGDRAGLGAALADGAGARRARPEDRAALDRARGRLVVVQLRGGGDREVDVPEGREPRLRDGLPVRLDEPRLRDRDRDLDLPRLAIHAGRVRRRPDPDRVDVDRDSAVSSRGARRRRPATTRARPRPGTSTTRAGRASRLLSLAGLVGRRAQLPRRLGDALEGDRRRLPDCRFRRAAADERLQRPLPDGHRRRAGSCSRT